MQFNPTALLALDIPETLQAYGVHECQLYALGVGAGMAPDTADAGRFLEEGRLVALPSMATVLGYEGFWIEQVPSGIDPVHALHAAQGLRMLAPLPRVAHIRRKTVVTDIVDRGLGRGAFVLTRDLIVDADTGMSLAELTSTILCRQEGGRGGTRTAMPAREHLPDTAPDGNIVLASSPQQCWIYRLSGDRNPLHTDPETARAAGFARPILHGLAVFGSACLGLVTALAGSDPVRVNSLSLRFVSPAFPGEPLALEYWRMDARTAAFRVLAAERNVVVADDGRFELNRPDA